MKPLATASPLPVVLLEVFSFGANPFSAPRLDQQVKWDFDELGEVENLRDCKVLVELLVTEEGTAALSGAKFGKCLKVSSSRVLPSPSSVDAGR